MTRQCLFLLTLFALVAAPVDAQSRRDVRENAAECREQLGYAPTAADSFAVVQRHIGWRSCGGWFALQAEVASDRPSRSGGRWGALGVFLYLVVALLALLVVVRRHPQWAANLTDSPALPFAIFWPFVGAFFAVVWMAERFGSFLRWYAPIPAILEDSPSPELDP